MTNEQKAAYIFAQSVAALAEIEGMKIENKTRELQGEYPQYGEDSFRLVIDKYGIHHNMMLGLFHGV